MKRDVKVFPASYSEMSLAGMNRESSTWASCDGSVCGQCCRSALTLHKRLKLFYWVIYLEPQIVGWLVKLNQRFVSPSTIITGRFVWNRWKRVNDENSTDGPPVIYLVFEYVRVDSSYSVAFTCLTIMLCLIVSKGGQTLGVSVIDHHLLVWLCEITQLMRNDM